jgi:hypothetical protein
MRHIDRRIFYVRQDQGELRARIPILGGLAIPGVLQIKGSVFDAVTVGVKENAPGLSGQRMYGSVAYRSAKISYQYYSPRGPA